jgi:molecular chaperone DnaJ
MADYYELLGISPNASQDEIKSAYRRRARELHPDANPDDPSAEERFKAVASAYAVLSDPEQRARYDRFGEAGVQGAGGGGGGEAFFGGGGLGDIFEAVFGGGVFGGRAGGPAGPPRGQDVETVADLTFEQAVFGATVSVSVRTAVRCPDCDGRGAGEGTQPVTCVECGGAGQVRRVRQSLLGQMVTASPCTRCSGYGEVVVTPCTTCRGEGRVIEQPTLKVPVPAGVDTGSTLRLSGRGPVGPRGGTAGDVYVHLRVAPHERFRRDGDDLVAELPVSIAQAALGTNLTFATLDGDEQLTVPAGTPHGREFRLRGRGVPRANGRGRGDVRVVVTVTVPTKLSKAQDELLRRYAEEAGESVLPADAGLLSKIRSAFR